MDPTLDLPGADRRPTVGFDPPPVDDEDLPAVPGYAVERPLGRGGMGVVVLARHLSLNRPVALKLLPAGRGSEAVRQRFQAEAESVARVSHPGVVQVFEVGTAGGRPYFALEYCSGGSLAAKLHGTPLPPRRAAEVVEAVARAVAAAHAAGLVHRDLKPDNVLFAADGSPKVADFGLAKLVDGDSHLTHDGAVLGTPSYMAPEQARGDSNAVGPAADGYALGAVLYECLTGRPPFRAATVLDTLAQVLNADPVAPRKLLPGLPRDLDTIALKCLEKDPGKRYPSAAAVADDLRRFLDGRPIVARPLGPVGRFLRMGRGNPLAAALAGLSFGLLVGNFAFVLTKNAALRRERNAAVVAQHEAEAARDDADAQRRKADDRLAAAVAAVEAMVGRAAGSAWLASPELQAERRKLLADAVGFYERLAGTDGNDPTVRREAAKAHLRAGRAWLDLSDHARAEGACRKAVERADGLLAGGDPAALLLAADARTALGQTLSVGADYPAAEREYVAAAALADRAVAARPGDPAAVLVAVRVRTVLAGLSVVRDPARAVEQADAAAALAAPLAAAPNAPPAHRLALAAALVQGAIARRGPATRAEAVERLDRAEAAVRGLDPADPKAAPELAEGLVRLRGTIHTQRAAAVLDAPAGPDDLRAGVRLFRAGVGAFDQLLRVRPKSFPDRLYKFLCLEGLLITYERLGDLAGRDAAAADLDRVAADILRDSPKATWLLARRAVPRTLRLVADVHAGRHARFDAEVADLLALADRLGTAHPAPLVRFNLACGHAQMSKLGPPADRDRHAAAAVRLLAGLAAAGAFADPDLAAGLATDSDLDPVRGRPDFPAVRK